MTSLHILISWTLLLTMVFLRYSHAQCPKRLFHTAKSWFGNDCEKTCRCQQNKCHTDGTCVRGFNCHPDWFGPSCQYKDYVRTNGMLMLSWLTDSNVLTCQPDYRRKAISVYLRQAIHFTWLKMEYKQIANFTIKFNNNELDCLNKRTYVISNYEMDVSCEMSSDVKQISVYGDLVGSLCNIFVSAGRNMALKQPTNQTSTFPVDNQPHTSDMAVDEILESCSCTSGSLYDEQTWQIFYRQPVFLYLTVVHRMDVVSVEANLEGFQLEKYGSNNERLQLYKEPGIKQDIYYVPMAAKSQPVSRLSITSRRYEDRLYFCEVETYGDMACSEGTWGPYCEHNCSCGRTEFCSPITGKCSPGCTAGFYGKRCDHNCSAFCDNQGCHYVTGECFQCVPGYMGKLCDVACPTGRYGNQCSMPCSARCLNSECRLNNGSCLSCPDKLYGSDCSMPCSARCLNNKCLPTNGSCLSCADTFYGSDCSRLCSDRCDGDLCYALTGLCKVCKVGFFTDLCDVPCRTNCEDMTCNRDTGYCESGCPPGKYGPECLLNCSQNCEVCDSFTCFKCSQSMYGDHCSSLCPQKCSNGTCEMKTGFCLSCVTGFFGDKCEKECPIECEGSACDFQTGKCPEPDNRHIDILTAAAIAGFLLLLIIIGFIILFKRKRHPPPKVEEEQAPPEEVPGVEVPKERRSVIRLPEFIRRKSSSFFDTGTWV